MQRFLRPELLCATIDHTALLNEPRKGSLEIRRKPVGPFKHGSELAFANLATLRADLLQPKCLNVVWAGLVTATLMKTKHVWRSGSGGTQPIALFGASPPLHDVHALGYLHEFNNAARMAG